MITQNEQHKTGTSLPNTPYIDTDLGLKYCNNNYSLYIKILNNFVKRYQHLNLNEVEDRKRTIHSLKGITATLGMTTLTEHLTELETSFNSTIINHFQHDLLKVIKEIVIKQ